MYWMSGQANSDLSYVATSPRSELGESTDWCQLGVQLMTDIPVTIQVGMLMH